MTRETRYFAYGSLQRGFPNHAAFADRLGEPLGRYRTIDPYPLVVPYRAACANPGCRFVHRMCALLPDRGAGVPVEGELFAVDTKTIEALDELEHFVSDDEAASTFLRRSVQVVESNGRTPAVDAQTYFIADAVAWRGLLERGEAEVVAHYDAHFAEGPLKRCCRERAGHDGPHDVVALG